MDKALNYLSLARKAGFVELGEEPAGAAARAQHARLIVVANDAGDHTWRRAKSFVAGTAQLCLQVPFSKDALGQAVGRQSLAIAAITDPALALAFVKALPQPEKYSAEAEALEARVQRVRQRQKEANAHQKNKKVGTRPAGAGKKQ